MFTEVPTAASCWDRGGRELKADWAEPSCPGLASSGGVRGLLRSLDRAAPARERLPSLGGRLHDLGRSCESRASHRRCIVEMRWVHAFCPGRQETGNIVDKVSSTGAVGYKVCSGGACSLSTRFVAHRTAAMASRYRVSEGAVVRPEVFACMLVRIVLHSSALPGSWMLEAVHSRVNSSVHSLGDSAGEGGATKMSVAGGR